MAHREPAPHGEPAVQTAVEAFPLLARREGVEPPTF